MIVVRVVKLVLLLLLLSTSAFAISEEVMSLYSDALKDYKEGRLPDAAKKFERILEKDPSFIEAYNDSGCCHLSMGDSARAIALFNRGLSIKPNDKTILFNLGKAYEGEKNYSQAVEIYERVLTIEPAFTNARRQAVIACIELNNSDKAVEHAQKLVDTEPANPLNRKHLIRALLLKEGNADRARQEISSLLAANPDDSDAKSFLDTLEKKKNTPIPSMAEVSASPSTVPSASPHIQQSGSEKQILLIMAAILALLCVLVIMVYLHFNKAPVTSEKTGSPVSDKISESILPIRDRHNDSLTMGDAQSEKSDKAQEKKDRGVEQASQKGSEGSTCWQLHKCNDDVRQSCVAFLESLNCWSFEKTPCCQKDRALCVLCPHYSARLQRAQKGLSHHDREFEVKGEDSNLIDRISNPQMSILREISAVLSATNEPEELGKVFLQKMADAVMCERAAIFLVDKEKMVLSYIAGYNWESLIVQNKDIDFSPLMYRWVADNHFPMPLQQARKDKNWPKFLPNAVERELYENFELIIPLMEEREKLQGFFLLGRKKTNTPYQPHEHNFLTLSSGMVAVSLEKARTYRLAVYDGLTNLYVVRHFREKLKEHLKSPKSLLQGCSLLMIDIDHFKKFNDTYGHQQGDTVLREVARLIKSNLRSQDIAARYGGEEMAVIFPATEKKVAFDISERMRRVVEGSRFPGLPESVRVTISLGVATYPQDAQAPEELVEKADQALYRAKHSGRNRTCC
ncbi:MAG: diguanylate cyclase [Candidatus Xenobiia bacterium LiM19]